MNRRWSIATGVALLVLAVVAGATQGLVFSGLDPDRPATFVDSGPALALAAVAFVTVVLLDVVIGWGLWRVLRDRAHRRRARRPVRPGLCDRRFGARNQPGVRG